MRLLLPLLMIPLAGCVTQMRGTEEPIAFQSVPEGATVRLSSGVTCTTPCTLTLPRGERQTAVFSKEGCAPGTGNLVPRPTGSGIAFGGVFDYASGAVYDLRPNPLLVALDCRPRS